MTGQVAKQLDWFRESKSYASTGALIAELRPEEPAYLYKPGHLAGRATRFRSGFPGRVSYAVKANPEARVLRTLIDQGLEEFDVASLAEIRAVLSMKPSARLHFNNPVKAIEAIRTAYRHFNVRSFALDDLAELEKIREATDADPEVMYTVRFKLAHSNASYDFGSKFGATPELATQLLHRVSQISHRPAITFHPGSQCTDPDVYAAYIAAAAEISGSAGVEPVLLNVGGGFPEYYGNTQAPPLEAFFERIGEAAQTSFTNPPPLLCEPGRGMVAASVSLLVKVIHVRENQHAIFVNDGLYGGMQEQSLVDIHLPVTTWRGDRELSGASADFQIFGPTCDPVDRLPRHESIPLGIRSGDYLEFGLLGAYGSAVATGFNGFNSVAYYNIGG